MTRSRLAHVALGCLFLASYCSKEADGLEVSMPKVVEAEVGKEATIYCNFFIPENNSYFYVKWFYMERNERKEILSRTQDRVESKESEMKERINITDDFALTISKVTPRDAKTYLCQVGAGRAGFSEKQTELRVSKAPETSVTVENEGIGASKNELSKIATCTSQNGYPTPSITWYKDQQPLYSNGTETDIRNAVIRESNGLFTVSSTLFERVTKEDRDAFYHCQVDYSLMGVSKIFQTENFQIKVLYPSENVSFVIDGPKQELKEGDRVTLRCKADGNPEPDYTVFKGEDKLLDGPSGELILGNITKEDSGTYHCLVFEFEIMKELKASVNLSVNYIDEPKITPKHHEPLKEGEDSLLTCDAKGSKPLEFKWKRKGKVVSKGKQLQLVNVTHETLGNYSCVVTVPEVTGLSRSRHFFVSVHSKPQLTWEQRPRYAQVNELSSLSCTAISVPKATVLWSTHNGTSTHSYRNNQVNSTLQIQVTPEHLKSGINCTAQNSLGLAEHHFRLEKRPDTPPPTTGIDKQKQESKGVIIVAVIVGILVIAILGAVLYFLHKKGKLPCGRSGKQEITRPEAHKDEIVVEVKSDKLPEEAGLLPGANGEKRSAGDQGEKYIDLRN
ncbi:cell surface glycoprotein MUC18 isoform X2 [Eublepharis macularius]|uniref:Cell surface glycoprotein MUC18 isoform X2 n=1 Tax=Eublepharis macularius TaxID=481883 RepID=A0AA97KCK7_EUBMA|nr:cell surface glycoprotein MUC18 isoform X2 [Eublepharis macularius]